MKSLQNCLTTLLLLVSTVCFSQNQLYDWRGVDRSGIYNETDLLNEWPTEGPTQVWVIEDGLGEGYSSPTVTPEAIYVTGKKDTLDCITALSHSGEKLWESSYGEAWKKSYSRSRCTPTVYKDCIFLISGMGDLVCFSTKGEKQWSTNPFVTFEGEYETFGICESPLVYDDKVIICPGGEQTSMVAYNIHTGQVIWKADPLGEKTHYVSPLLVEHNGTGMIITQSKDQAFGVNSTTGELLWKYDYNSLLPKNRKRNVKEHANTPIYQNGQIFIFSGYDHPGAMLQLAEDGKSVTLLWKTEEFDTHHGGAVLLDNYLYGSNYLNNAKGNWLCMDWKTGEVAWETQWHTKGSIVSADDKIFLYEEKTGYVGLAKPRNDTLQVISEFKFPYGTGPHWTHPVIVDKKLYI